MSSSGLSRGSIVQHTPSFGMGHAKRSYWTYIRVTKPRGTLYVGITNGLITRVEQHRAGQGSSFTRKYRVHILVWYQEYADVREAIQREKTIKRYTREWKINLIERTNPHRSTVILGLVPRIQPSAGTSTGTGATPGSVG